MKDVFSTIEDGFKQVDMRGKELAKRLAYWFSKWRARVRQQAF